MRKLPPAIQRLERQLFLNNSALRAPGIDIWTALKEFLPLYQKLGTADRIRSVLSEDWYESDLLPSEIRTALNAWGDQHGYTDAWFKNIGAVQLYFWTRDPGSLESDHIHVPIAAFSGFDDGVPPPLSFAFQMVEWRPYTGEQWSEFTKRAHKEFELRLRQYRSACFELCPSLAHLRGYDHYEALARFQARLLPSPVDDTLRKQIARTAKRLGLTLRTQVVDVCVS